MKNESADCTHTKEDQEGSTLEENKQETGPWEDQLGWLYIGHGEWTQTDCQLDNESQINKIEIAPDWVVKWLNTNDEDIQLHNKVWEGGYPNRWGARIQVPSRFNIQLLQHKLKDYHDQEILEWLKYGWPTGRLPTLEGPGLSTKNLKGANDFPDDLRKYIHKETGYGAIMGPYDKIPFTDNVGISPLSTQPKKNTTERRVILDLSFPIGKAVNDGIPKDTYMGFKAELRFPKTDEFAFRIYQLGQGCLMFKVDLSRYFRQIPLDPGDYSLIGYIVDRCIYFDKVLPMGMWSAPYIAQRITNAIAYIHQQMQFFLLNYVDDFVGAELKENIWATYQALTQLLEDLRVETSQDKVVPLTDRLEFLGITFDSNTMTMEISEQKMRDIKKELQTWFLKTSAKRREVESLVGKLQSLAKCVRAGRIFLSRLIQWIRTMDRRYEYSIPQEARKDIAWWARFIEEYNGVALMWLVKEPGQDTIVQTDACLTGYGGICGQQYFRAQFPVKDQNRNIAVLEMWAVMVALKIWAKELKGKYFWIQVDNEAVAAVINSGSSRHPELQNSLSNTQSICNKSSIHSRGRQQNTRLVVQMEGYGGQTSV